MHNFLEKFMEREGNFHKPKFVLTDKFDAKMIQYILVLGLCAFDAEVAVSPFATILGLPLDK